MEKLLREYSKIIGYTFVGLVFGAAFFLLFLNFYHYKDISEVYVKGETAEKQNAEVQVKLQEVKNIISSFNPNTYRGSKDKLMLMTINSKLKQCVTEFENEEFQKLINQKEMTAVDIYKFQNAYQGRIINNCVVSQLYELGLTGTEARFNDPDVAAVAPFIKLNADILRQDTDYVYKILLNNGSYYFSSESSKRNIYDLPRDSYSEVNRSYLNSVDFLLEVSRWYKKLIS